MQVIPLILQSQEANQRRRNSGLIGLTSLKAAYITALT
jgi:hypothetical protein